MAIDQELNKILKEMWRLDEKIVAGESLIETEKVFYNQYLETISNYYEKNGEYWQYKTKL